MRAGEINSVDLAFVVDTTGSMGPFIDAARRQMVGMIDGLSRAADVSMRLGVVEYRDHPPQDRIIYRAHAMTADPAAAHATIAALRPDGGGDGPEAVLDGVLAACRDLDWRPHARRVAVLVGDAPPHGVGARGDGFPRGCPCGQTVDSVTAAAEEARVTLHALGLTPAVADSFGALARQTGGAYFPASAGRAAIERLAAILGAEFGHLDLDRRVLDAYAADPDGMIDAIADRLGETPAVVAASVVRLSARRLLRPAAVLQGET